MNSLKFHSVDSYSNLVTLSNLCNAHFLMFRQILAVEIENIIIMWPKSNLNKIYIAVGYDN